jgi:hypothetical protein
MGKYTWRVSDKVDYPTWQVRKNKTIVLIDSGTLKAAHTLPAKDYKHFYLHPFFGVFPHEVEEARCNVCFDGWQGS